MTTKEEILNDYNSLAVGIYRKQITLSHEDLEAFTDKFKSLLDKLIEETTDKAMNKYLHTLREMLREEKSDDN